MLNKDKSLSFILMLSFREFDTASCLMSYNGESHDQ